MTILQIVILGLSSALVSVLVYIFGPNALKAVLNTQLKKETRVLNGIMLIELAIAIAMPIHLFFLFSK